jgi:putative oxidoreductase
MSVQPNPEQETSPAAGSGKGMHVALWALQIVLAVYMLAYAAIPRLFGLGTSIEMFEAIGLGQWFRYFVGALELLGSIGLLIPRLAGLAGLGLAGLMIGATYTNLFVIPGGIWVYVTTGLFILSAIVAVGRWSDIKALLSKGKG